MRKFHTQGKGKEVERAGGYLEARLTVRILPSEIRQELVLVDEIDTPEVSVKLGLRRGCFMEDVGRGSLRILLWLLFGNHLVKLRYLASTRRKPAPIAPSNPRHFSKPLLRLSPTPKPRDYYALLRATPQLPPSAPSSASTNLGGKELYLCRCRRDWLSQSTVDISMILLLESSAVYLLKPSSEAGRNPMHGLLEI